MMKFIRHTGSTDSTDNKQTDRHRYKYNNTDTMKTRQNHQSETRVASVSQLTT